MSGLLQTAIDAISLGGLIALLSLGIALIFGIMRLVNFAHGEFIMIGGYTLFVTAGQPLVLMLLVAVVVVVGFALLTERVAIRPVRGASPSTLMVTSFAVSYLLQNIAYVAFGSDPQSVTISSSLIQTFDVGPVSLRAVDLLTIGVAVVFIGALGVFFTRTLIGRQMRAAAQDFQMARLLGVRANTVIAVAFAVSGLLAAAVSILYVAQTGVLTPTMGLQPVILGFVATVLGGMDSLPGAALGGFLLGIILTLLQTWLPGGLSEYRDAFAYVAVVLVLLVRPEGLLASQRSLRRV